MNVTKITDKIHYIGVNDRTTPRFEALWSLPNGVCYNSYLVDGGDKVAIIDGVETAMASRFIGHIREIIGERKPDYLIINHMEPDHSGAITVLRQEYPDMVIVGNGTTLQMVKGFYGIEENTRLIKDGETLSLGSGVDLQFHLTPMVHWPETMMTFVPQEKVIFTGDAFGCFGALNGAIIDRDMDSDPYFPEMVRYYACIVGRYGQFVQRALNKVGKLDFDTICSTHGPVWRERKDEVMSIYDKLSRYEPLDNGCTIVYGTMYGNMERAAEALAGELAAQGVRPIKMYNAANADLSEMLADVFRHRGLAIASTTYSDGIFPPVREFFEALVTRKVTDREVAFLGSCSWSQQAIKAMQAYFDTLSLTPVDDGISFKHAPTQDSLKEARNLATSLASRLK